MKLRVVAAALCLAVALSGGCKSPEEEVAEHLALAETYTQQGKAREAILELRAALQIDPKNGKICSKLARLYERAGDVQQAYFFYVEASRLEPEAVAPKLALARLVLGEDPKESRRLTEEVLAKRPKNAQAWSRLTEVLLVEGNTDEALAAILTAVELEPAEPEFQYQLGRVHQARFRKQLLDTKESNWSILEESLAALDRAIELQKGGEKGAGIDSYLERAKVLAAFEGRGAEVEQAYKDAFEQAGDVASARRVVRAAIEYGRGRSPGLVRWAMEKGVEKEPGAIGYWLRLAESAESEEAGSGRAVLDRMIAVTPESAGARALYARFLIDRGQVEQALAFLAEAEADERVEDKALVAAERGFLLLSAKRDLEGARQVLARLEKDHPDSVDRALLDAQLALAEGRPKDAAAVLEPQLERQAEAARVRAVLANAYFRAGDNTKAAAVLEQALAANADDTDMLALQALVLSDQGLHQDALRVLARLRELRALTGHERILLGDALYATGRDDQGRQVFDALLEGDPSRPVAALAFSRHLATRNPKRARAVLAPAYDKAIGPIKVEILEVLTGLDLAEGAADAALARINELIQQGVGGPRIALLRAKVLMAHRQPQLAEKDLLTAIEQDPSSDEAYNLLVRIYSAQGRAEEAIASFEEAAKAGVLRPETKVVLARLHLSLGHDAEARELYTSALQERADLPLAKNDLAYLLADSGQELDRALTLAQEARSALPDDPNTADTLGWVYLKRGLAESAAFQFKEAVSAAGRAGRSSPLFHHHLGLALRELGREEEARAEFEAALKLDPAFSQAEEARKALEDLGARAG